jgi:hypothetical protein
MMARTKGNMNDLYAHRLMRFPSGDTGTFDDAPRMAPLIVGMRRQTAPPLFFGAKRLHRMHVLVIHHPDAVEEPSPAADVEQVLPRLNRLPADMQARPVHGEILRGEYGEWYERVGQCIRPLRQLMSGPRGEVLEMPAANPPARVPLPAKEEPAAEESPEASNTAASPPAPAFRSLLADPGAARVLMFGAYKPLLLPQLSEPNRLRDSHRLRCHVRVFEATTSQPVENFARAILGDHAGPADLQPLTMVLAAQLELFSQLPPPANVPPFSPEQKNVRPGQRFFQLKIAGDPTMKPVPASASAPAADPAPTPPANPSPVTPPPKLTSIPALLHRPWEFLRSREEAISRLRRADGWLVRLTRPLLRLRHRQAFRRWQLLLSGRSADEQLWIISPPESWLGDPWLRDWARGTLELGGYDAAAMLSEWEIFWSRKTH